MLSLFLPLFGTIFLHQGFPLSSLPTSLLSCSGLDFGWCWRIGVFCCLCEMISAKGVPAKFNKKITKKAVFLFFFPGG
jgi:hypothetical protein